MRERGRQTKSKGKNKNERKKEFGVNLVKKKRRNEEIIDRVVEERQIGEIK
jgi:hypothetical protein